MKALFLISANPDSEALVTYGGILTRALKADSTLLHVVQTKEDLSDGEQWAAQIVERLADQVVETSVKHGNRIRQTLSQARHSKYDLIIISVQDFHGLVPRLLGLKGTRPLRPRTSSVLIVNHSRDSIQRILICTGGLDVSDKTITGGAFIAQTANAQVTVLHVVKPVPSMYTGLQEVDETLPELLQSDTPFSQHLINSAETLTRYQLDAKLEIRHGMVDREILRESQVGDYDLIVMGAKEPKGYFQEWFLGDITNEVIAHAPCPVLVLSKQGLVEER